MVDNGSGIADATANRFAADMRAKAGGKARRALSKAQGTYETAAERAKRAGRQADRLISDQTYPALGVAAVLGLGIGLAIGLVLAGRD